ncbi:tetratricopeptide repeat protein [Roseofilum sp. BLCC_M91]|uniref:Tetratricopeptide repeat protein n=1 Tax=Roseofilum halophilum BLCC-M91 TaxID=3022259 RepID=A0ABT7BEC1_9CYAN|nr:CHAT domain-containing protein [Roseofilum halophilum]MDJ1177538.1 tetratricopeptide repeat protein [Roseofilum halophilum BLCC-M91]
MRIEAAQRRIQAFERKFDQPHLFLAAHAALPLALTPDLLYRIWVNFQRDLEGKSCKIPWIAVSDLLLSSLCDEVGYELFEMEDTIRHELLQKLSQNQRQQVAAFLLQYVQADLKSRDSYYREFAQSQSWAAQAYLHPEKAIELLADAINTAYRENPDDLMRLTTLTELFAQDVPEFDKLLIYARAIGHAARNRFQETKEELIKLKIKNGITALSNTVVVSLPPELLDQPLNQEEQFVQSLVTARNQYNYTHSLLEDNQHLMTKNLLQTIKQVISFMLNEGNEEIANWLKDIEAQVSEQVVEISPHLQLFLELLQAIVETNTYVDVCYSILCKNLDKLDIEFAEAMSSWSRENLPELDRETVQFLASAIGNLSNVIQKFPLGSRADNMEIAITGYNIGLTVIDQGTDPMLWANLQNNLGTAYSERLRGERAENLEQAIACYEAALEVYTREAFPQDWATTQNNLGAAYSDRIRGERAENLERAIACYEAALQVYPRSAFAENWASVQNNLGSAYSNRIRGERAENLERAIACYENALQVYTRSTFPQNWASVQNNLGSAYSKRILGESAENLERAIACYYSALEVYTREAFPQDWATTQNNLGAAYSDRIRGERAENLERAIACYENALQVYTRSTFPENWASVQNNLGSAYSNRIRGERAENLERAIACYEAALQVYPRSAFAENWASVQNNLGSAYSNRIRGERAENLERAIACYQAALQVYTREAFSQNHAEILFKLGLTYRDAAQSNLAYTAFEQAIDTVEYLRGEIISGDEARRKLNEEWNQLYQQMVEVCLDLGNYTTALEYADRSKARNFVELLATREVYPQGIPPAIRQRLQELRQSIAAENQRLSQDPNPDYTHINQLRQEFQEISPYQPLEFSTIQSLIDEETAVLEWYILHDSFITFILTSKNISVWTSSEEDLNQLNELVNTYLQNYHTNKYLWRTDLTQYLKQLSQTLHITDILEILLQKLPNAKKLILIPYRYLHIFALHALPIISYNPKLEDKALLEFFPKGISYAPNLQLLKDTANRSRPYFNQLFAIQNTSEDLVMTDLEVEKIKEYFSPSTVLKGGAATKEAVLSSEALYSAHCIHISGHGNFNLASPLDSGILLAGSANLDSMDVFSTKSSLPRFDMRKNLTIDDILLRLNLSQCRLVTLSACESSFVGLDTDEHLSFQGAFLLSGAKNVVGSLWSLPDLSTAILMIKFYQNLFQNKPVQSALAEAQIWLKNSNVRELTEWLEELNLNPIYRLTSRRLFLDFNENDLPFSNPYHWAAFTVTGAL